MAHQFSSIDSGSSFVADTSVIINLVACAIPEEIIAALPARLLVTDEVLFELDRGKEKSPQDAICLRELINARLVECVALDVEGWSHFERLVSGSAIMTLDDGEASTIAYCIENGAIPILDEKKALRICREHYTDFVPLCTPDIFFHVEQTGQIEASHLADAVFHALHVGRMRVRNEHIEWILETIGEERAKLCTSLPKRIRDRVRKEVVSRVEKAGW